MFIITNKMFDFNLVKHKAFNEFKFHEKTHQYFYRGKKLRSSTSIKKDYKEEFDDKYWIVYKALKNRDKHILKADRRTSNLIGVDGNYLHFEAVTEQFSLSKEIITLREEWDYLSDLGTYKGSELHLFIENFYKNKIYIPENTHIDYPNLTFKDIETEYKINQKQFLNFYKDTKGYLIPLDNEVVIGDEEFLISGMIDQLFYDTRINKPVIYDWKTNKEFTTKNYWEKLLYPFDEYDACSLSEFSLQLNIYRYIFEKKTGIKMGDPMVVYLGKNNDNYELYKMHDFQKLLKKHVFIS